MMDSTVVFLDIDGALCPYDTDWRRSGLPALSTRYDYKRITPLQVPIAAHVEDFVRSLTPENAVWSSSWGDISIAINESLGTDNFQHTMTNELLIQGKEYCLEVFLKDHPEIQRVILVEDEPYEVNADVDVVYVSTHRFTGMTVEQVEFVSSLLTQ